MEPQISGSIGVKGYLISDKKNDLVHGNPDKWIYWCYLH